MNTDRKILNPKIYLWRSIHQALFSMIYQLSFFSSLFFAIRIWGIDESQLARFFLMTHSISWYFLQKPIYFFLQSTTIGSCGETETNKLISTSFNVIFENIKHGWHTNSFDGNLRRLHFDLEQPCQIYLGINTPPNFPFVCSSD